MPKKTTPEDVGRQLGYAQEELRKAEAMNDPAMREALIKSAKIFIEQANEMLERLLVEDKNT